MRKTTDWEEWCAPWLLARCGGDFFLFFFFVFVSGVKSVFSGEWDGAEQCEEVLSTGAHVTDSSTSWEQWFIPLALCLHALLPTNYCPPLCLYFYCIWVLNGLCCQARRLRSCCPFCPAPVQDSPLGPPRPHGSPKLLCYVMTKKTHKQTKKTLSSALYSQLASCDIVRWTVRKIMIDLMPRFSAALSGAMKCFTQTFS